MPENRKVIMTQIIVNDNGINKIVEHTIPVPAYDIGTLIEFKDEVNPKELIEATIVGYSIEVINLDGTLVETILYSTETGHTVTEEDIVHYYDDTSA